DVLPAPGRNRPPGRRQLRWTHEELQRAFLSRSVPFLPQAFFACHGSCSPFHGCDRIKHSLGLELAKKQILPKASLSPERNGPETGNPRLLRTTPDGLIMNFMTRRIFNLRCRHPERCPRNGDLEGPCGLFRLAWSSKNGEESGPMLLNQR